MDKTSEREYCTMVQCSECNFVMAVPSTVFWDMYCPKCDHPFWHTESWPSDKPKPKFNRGDRVIVSLRGGIHGTVRSVYTWNEHCRKYRYNVDYDDGVQAVPMEEVMAIEPKAADILVITEEATGVEGVTYDAIDSLKSSRRVDISAPTTPQSKPNVRYISVSVGDGTYFIPERQFDLMKPGVEYQYADDRFISNVVVRRDGDKLFGRKLETFAKLSELE